MGRKLGCMAGYVGLALSLLGLCLYVARNPVRDLLGRAASAWVSRRLTGTLEIGALRGSLFSSLVWRDVVLRDQQGAEVARLDEVQLSYDLTALLRRRLVVQRVDLVRPRITLVQEPGGQWNIDHVLAPLFPVSRSPAPARPTGGKLPVAIVLQRLQIHDGQIAVQAPALPGVQSIALTVEGPPDAVVVRAQLNAAGGRFDLHGQLNTVAAPWRYSGSLALTHVNLATLLHQELLQSDLNLQLHLEGAGFSPEALRGAARLDIQPSAVGGITLHPSGCHIAAQLHVQGTGFAVSQRRAEVDLRLETSGLTLAPGLTARLQGGLSGNTLQLEEVRVPSALGIFVARGTLSLTATTPAHTSLTYAVTLGDLTPLQRYLGVPLQAQGSLSGTVQGTWPALQARHRLQLRDWRYGAWRGQRMQTELAIAQFPTAPQATAKAHVVDVQGPALPRSSLLLTGTSTPSQGTVQASVTAGPYHKTGLEGRFTWADEQLLTLSHLRLQHQALAWENAGPITIGRDAQGRLALQRLLLRSGRQEVRAQGILMPGGGFEADVQVQHLLLLPHVRAVAPALGAVDGEVALHLSLRGTLTHPQGEGVLHVTSLRWQHHTLGEVYSQLRANGTTVGVDLHWRDQQRQLLHLYGDIALDRHTELALQLQATDVDLHVLTAFSSAVAQSAGTLQVELRLAGTLLQPQAYGTVRLNDGMLQLAATGVQYRAIQAQLVCTGQWVELTRLHAESGDGSLDLTGWAESPRLTVPRLDMVLRMHQFTLMHTPDLEAVVSAAVTLRGSLEEMVATGTVTVPRARAQLSGKLVGGPEAVQPWQLTVHGVYGSGPPKTVATEVTAAARQTASLAFLRADVQLQLPRNVWVRGPGTAIEINGALTASERSGLSGQAQQIVGNVAAGELEQLLAKPLGLDSLDIQTGDKLGSGKVSVGRYITQDLFLSYERRHGGERDNKVGVEYSINHHLKVKGSSSDTGDAAVDVLWRIDY